MLFKTRAMVTLENYEAYMILDADGELDAGAQKELQAFLTQHPDLQKEYELYRSVSLSPDMTEVYTHKQKLFKEVAIRTISFNPRWLYGIAAGVAALVGITLLISDTKETTVNPIVAVTPITDRSLPTDDTILHSIPVKPVIHENNTAQGNPSGSIAQNRTNPKTLKIQQPISNNNTGRKQESLTAISALPVQEVSDHISGPEVAVITVPDMNMPSAAAEETATAPAFTLLNLDKNQNLLEIKDVVTAKIEKAKEIKNNIKNTDVALKFGSKELFVVKF